MTVFMSNWISVKDKLPESGEAVIAYTDANKIVIRKFCKNKFAEMNDKVSFWMPLPSRPVENK